MAVPNALLTLLLAKLMHQPGYDLFSNDAFNEDGTSNALTTDSTSKAAQSVIATFTAVMIFILYNRSRTSYNRWWEGGTLLQKTRGEWFNAYSSIMAFTATNPEMEEMVDSYCHLLARLFSLLMCCGLQQVSPYRDRPFEIIDLGGIEPESMEFLNSAPDKVEVILQWIQRSMVLHMQTGVLPVSPPILSRAFQEVSRGIVNLQNARKIADFPYPFPLAQLSMILQMTHYVVMPFASVLALPTGWAVCLSFISIFVLWCIHFNALDLEFPFGTRVNDLPMNEMQQDWNNSLITLLDRRATRPPAFGYDPVLHDELAIVMSDASALYVPSASPPLDRGVAVIKVVEPSSQSEDSVQKAKSHRKTVARRSSGRVSSAAAAAARTVAAGAAVATAPKPATVVGSHRKTIKIEMKHRKAEPDSECSSESGNSDKGSPIKLSDLIASEASEANNEVLRNRSVQFEPEAKPGCHIPPNGVNAEADAKRSGDRGVTWMKVDDEGADIHANDAAEPNVSTPGSTLASSSDALQKCSKRGVQWTLEEEGDVDRQVDDAGESTGAPLTKSLVPPVEPHEASKSFFSV